MMYGIMLEGIYMEQSSTDENYKFSAQKIHSDEFSCKESFYHQNRTALWMILIGTLMLLLVSQAHGLSCTDEICENPIDYNKTCCVVTPTLTGCSVYDYQLFTNAGELIETGSLSVYNDTLTSYFFNFARPEGTYYARICDGSTRQLIVKGDNMIGYTPETWLLFTLVGMFILFIWLAFKAHPIFMVLSALIMVYFAYYSYTIYQSIFVTTILSLFGIILIFIGVLGSIYHASQ
jgi:hypothetical protein